MRLDYYEKSPYGISDKLCDYYWVVSVICGIVTFIALTIKNPTEWGISLFCSLFFVWAGGIAVILPIFILEYIIWGLFHPKKVYKSILIVLGIGLVFIISGWLAIQITQYASSRFADPDPSNWEFAYVSESPNAHRYHYSKDCNALRNTSYDIEMLTVEEAKDLFYKPCKVCLKNTVRYQWDGMSGYLLIPIFVFMIWLIVKIKSLAGKYKLRNPIIKRKEK